MTGFENLKAEDVDRYVPSIQIPDDPLARRVEFRGDDDDLVALVQGIRIERLAETSGERFIQRLAPGITAVDARDFLRLSSSAQLA